MASSLYHMNFSNFSLHSYPSTVTPELVIKTPMFHLGDVSSQVTWYRSILRQLMSCLRSQLKNDNECGVNPPTKLGYSNASDGKTGIFLFIVLVFGR